MVKEESAQHWTPVTFYSLPTGERYLHFGVRATPKVALMGDHGAVARMRASLPAMLADIEELVTCESPSADLDAVARSADVVARVGERRLGAAPERIVLDGRTHLRWRLGGDGPRVLLLGHHDTVWPLGSLATHPFGGRRRRAARPGLLRHEGRCGDGASTPPPR